MSLDASRVYPPPRLRIGPWTAVLACLGLIPMLVVGFVLFDQLARPDGAPVSALALALVLMLVSGYYFARLYFLCSVALNGQGVTQSHLLQRVRRGPDVHLAWDQVQRASSHGATYVWIGQDGSKAVLNTRLFQHPVAVALSVRLNMPNRLLRQMDADEAHSGEG